MPQAYHGGLQHVRDPSARASRVHKVIDKAAAAVDAISKQAGLQCQVVTGGGSGTYRVEAASGVFTEVQPGAHLQLAGLPTAPHLPAGCLRAAAVLLLVGHTHCGTCLMRHMWDGITLRVACRSGKNGPR